MVEGRGTGESSMNRRALCIAVLAGLMLAGCANLGPHDRDYGHQRFRGPQSLQPKAAVECAVNGPCDIPVDVVTVIGNGTSQTWIVAPDTEIATGNHGVKIHWHLTNHDYYFQNDSIAFYEARSRDQFSGPGTGGDGAEFHWTDRNSDVHGYGYQIKVYNRKTGDWLTLDPFIWNNN